MARVSVKRPLVFEQEQALLERLFSAVAELRNWQEAEAFLMEFLTREELVMLAKRLELYKRVGARQMYKIITRDLGATSQTICAMKKKMARADVYFLRVMRKLVNLDGRFGEGKFGS